MCGGVDGKILKYPQKREKACFSKKKVNSTRFDASRTRFRGFFFFFFLVSKVTIWSHFSQSCVEREREREHLHFFLHDVPTDKTGMAKGHAGVEPATYRAATDCSTTELMPLPATHHEERDLFQSNARYYSNWEASCGRKRHCVRVVKELVLKGNGLCPRERSAD